MNPSQLLALIAVVTTCLINSCNVGPVFKKPETKVDAKFGGVKQGAYSSDASVSEWWTRLHDAQLNSLVSRALANNLDLKITAARIEEANALRKSARFDFFPTVRSEASYTNNKYSSAQLQATSFEVYSAGFDAAWELDLWGRVGKSYKATQADLAAAQALRHDTMVSLTAQLASAYLELRGLQNQLAVARRNADNQRETLKLTESLLQGGRGTELDTSRAKAQYNTTLAAIPQIESSISRDIHRISVLIGEQPTVLEKQLSEPKDMPHLPSLVRIGRPADLIRRRPDIQAAEKNLEAATERVGVAVADLFPRLTFNGTVAVQASNLSGLGASSPLNSTFGPGLSWAAFDLGRVKSQIDAAGARAKGQLATYQKTVLGALEESENALTDFGRQRARREFLRQASESSEQAAKLARDRYQNGVADFLTVLDAERTQLLAESDLAASETVTATALVAIYKALGGGWEGR